MGTIGIFNNALWITQKSSPDAIKWEECGTAISGATRMCSTYAYIQPAPQLRNTFRHPTLLQALRESVFRVTYKHTAAETGSKT